MIERIVDLPGNVLGFKASGWDDLSAFTAHMRFVRDHRHSVKRLAVVSNDHLLSAIPKIAGHLVVAEARHFAFDDEEEALAWVSRG